MFFFLSGGDGVPPDFMRYPRIPRAREWEREVLEWCLGAIEFTKRSIGSERSRWQTGDGRIRVYRVLLCKLGRVLVTLGIPH